MKLVTIGLVKFLRREAGFTKKVKIVDPRAAILALNKVRGFSHDFKDIIVRRATLQLICPVGALVLAVVALSQPTA
jgi:CheY-like chemotaxis protein